MGVPQTFVQQTAFPKYSFVGTYYNPYIGNNPSSMNMAVFDNGTEGFSGYLTPNLEMLESDFNEQTKREVLPQGELEVDASTQERIERERQKEIAARKRANYNQARGITTADAYAKQKALRDAGYDVTYDGYWGDASAAAWEDYMQTKAANMTPRMETPSLAVAPSVTRPGTTPKATDPNSPEANRQRFLDEQAAKIATAKMPSQFSGIDIMGAMKAEEARKKAELEALMQQQGAGSKLLNTDPHNIQGGYVVPVEPLYDMSKMDTHNQFGLKFYKGGMIPSRKQGGSLKKCSCGCKTLLKKGKGGKVMESRNCK